jgi:RNA polymerase sigma factor (sigma-70 family)
VSSTAWWTGITADDVLRLRARVVAFLAATFPTLSAADCDDLTQQAFVGLLRHREKVRPDDDGLFRYLAAAARNAALDRFKSMAVRRRADLPESAGRSLDPAPDAATQGEEQNERIREIFCELDALDRFVLWRSVVDGRSLQSIANELDLNWHRVDAILARTLREVRRRLRERE